MSSIRIPVSHPTAASLRRQQRFDTQAFARVFNPRSVALAFYAVLAMVLSSTLSWSWGEGFERWFFLSGYMVRQFMVSAACVLLAVAAAEALLPPAWTRRARCSATGALIALAAMLAAAIRMQLGRSNLSPDLWLSWFIATVALWTLLGTLAHWLYTVAREEERARADLAQAQREQERLALQATEAQLSALQAQIEPHFLFNSLATVKRLYETDASRGRQMMASLIAYFRAVLPAMRSRGSTLGAELELVRSYLTILKLRMGERLQFDVRCEEALARLPIPPMLLPTLVENAIKHGLTPLPEGGHIDVRAFVRDGRLYLQVADSGRGFVAAGGSGVGLANTRQRLAALYGEQACLRLRTNAPRGVVAEIDIPLARLAV